MTGWLFSPGPRGYTTASREASKGCAVTMGSRLRLTRLVGRGLTRYSPSTDTLPEDAPLAGDTLRLVAPHLPVEGGLERVLVGQGPALDEEQVLEVGRLREARIRGRTSYAP